MSQDIHENDHDDEQPPVPPPDAESAITLNQMTLPQIERTLELDPVMLAHDEMLRRVLLARALLERALEYKRRVEEAAILWFKAHGALFNGPIIYVATPEKKVRCIDQRLGLELLLQLTEGDLDTTAAYMASSPFKYGSCAKLMSPEQWMQVFQEIRRDRLILKALDRRFLPKSKQKKGNGNG
jgi:hypothetical protein